MERIFIKGRFWLIAGAVGLLLSTPIAAEQLNVDFVVPENTIKTLGSYPDDTLTVMISGTGDLRVLKGSPLAPTALGVEATGNARATYSGGNIGGTVGTGDGNGGFYFVHSTVNVTSGDTFFVRTWNTAKSCYIDTAGQSISWADSPLPSYQLNYTSATAYWARQPGAPTITAIAESLQRNNQGTPADPNDDTYDLTLTVTAAYSESATHIQLADIGTHKKYRIHCYKAADPSPPDLNTSTEDPRVKESNGGSASFSGGNGYFVPGTYRIVVYVFNWFGNGSYTLTPDYQTLSGGGGPITKEYTFNKLGGSFGINQFSVPIGSSLEYSKTAATWGAVTGASLKALVQAINDYKQAEVVKSIGWWDPDSQRSVGYTITYPFAATPLGGAPALEDASPLLVRDKSYQLTVLDNVTGFKLRGNRD